MMSGTEPDGIPVVSLCEPQIHIARNQSARELAADDPLHREHIMKLIGSVAGARSFVADVQPSLCIIGAGNCRDIDLNSLVNTFESIHLVDLDRDAVAQAVEHLGSGRDRIQLHVPVDIASPLLEWQERTSQFAESDGKLSPEEIANFIQQIANETPPAGIPRADVVLSVCVLSQLIDSLTRLVAASHLRFENMLLALRIGHLRRLLSLCRPGGAVILVTDVVSSLTAPELTSRPENELADYLKTCVRSRNFFSGCNPDGLLRDFQMLSAATRRIEHIQTVQPWVWNPGPKAYGVAAIVATLRG